VNDYVDAGNNSNLNITDAITILVWTNNISGSNGHIVNKGGGWSENGYSLFWYLGNIRIELQNTAYSKKTILDNTAPALNKWNFIAFTWSLSSQIIKTYINGVQAGNTALFNVPIGIASQNLNIGRNQVRGYYFNGLIDEVRIYNRALSDSEIKALYDATK